MIVRASSERWTELATILAAARCSIWAALAQPTDVFYYRTTLMVGGLFEIKKPIRQTLQNCSFNNSNSFFIRRLLISGLEEPRKAVSGLPLKSTRLISTTVFKNEESSDNYSVLLMIFGQFISHDIISTPTRRIGSALMLGLILVKM